MGKAGAKAQTKAEENEEEGTTGMSLILGQAGGGALAESDYDPEDMGAGFEHTSQADFQIPLLVLLQKGSPQVDTNDDKYNEDARPGMIMNTVTGELTPGDKGLLFIPVTTSHKFIEWIPRENGGGYVGAHEPTDPMVMEARKGGAFGKLETPSGNNLKETFSIFGLVVDEKTGQESYAVIPFSSSQIKHYKKFLTKARSIVARTKDGARMPLPLYAHVFRLTTGGESNAKGSWSGWVINFANENAENSRLPKDNPLFMAARGFREMAVQAQEQGRVDYGGAGAGDTATEGADDSPAQPGKF